MESNWLYGHKCIKGGRHEETFDIRFRANTNIIFCSKCDEFLYDGSKTVSRG